MFKKIIFIVVVLAIVVGAFLKFSHISYESHFNKGLEYFKSGDYKKAIAEYKKAEKKTVPSDESLQYALANAYAQIKDYDKAITAYETVIKYYPNDERAYKLLASVHTLKATEQRDIEGLKKALEYIERGYELAPSKMSESDMNLLKTLREQLQK